MRFTPQQFGSKISACTAVLSVASAAVSRHSRPADCAGRHVADPRSTVSGLAAREVREHYTKPEYRIPCGTAFIWFTAVYVPRTLEGVPAADTRTPYACPLWRDAYKSTLGPSKEFQEQWVTRGPDARGRTCQRRVPASAVRARQAVAEDVDETRTRMIRSSGC